jgi:hypothetical protein
MFGKKARGFGGGKKKNIKAFCWKIPDEVGKDYVSRKCGEIYGCEMGKSCVM